MAGLIIVENVPVPLSPFSSAKKQDSVIPAKALVEKGIRTVTRHAFMNKCEFNPLIFVGMPGKWLNMRKPRHAHDGYLAGFTFSNKGMSGYGKLRFFNKPFRGNDVLFDLISYSK